MKSMDKNSSTFHSVLFFPRDQEETKIIPITEVTMTVDPSHSFGRLLGYIQITIRLCIPLFSSIVHLYICPISFFSIWSNPSDGTMAIVFYDIPQLAA